MLLFALDCGVLYAGETKQSVQQIRHIQQLIILYPISFSRAIPLSLSLSTPKLRD